MNLFDPDFYPTPPEVIKKMIAPYADRLGTATILEPSAGNGAILEYITKTGTEYEYTARNGTVHRLTATADPRRVYAVEHNPELQMIIQQKGYRLAGENFLAYRPDIRFNLILMNPPFSHGADHLLHAWDILDGGDIACLLNAETVRNPCTETRKLLARIIGANGTVEELSRCFRSSDHPTDVEVVLVRLHKEPKANPFTIDLSGTDEAAPDFGGMAASGNALEQSSRLDAYIRSWDKAKEAAVAYIRARETLRFYLGAFVSMDKPGTLSGADIVKVIDDTLVAGTLSTASMETAYNEFVAAAKTRAWDTIFRQIGIEKYMTTGLNDELDRFRQNQSSMEINRENIMRLLNYILSNVSEIMDNAVVEVYDMFTRYFDGNTSCTEGWKTNKRFSCNRKVILPDCICAGFMPQRYGYSKYYSVDYSHRSRLDDIDKAMCWLTGRRFEELTGEMDIPGQGKAFSPADSTIAQVIPTIAVGDQAWHESAFFRIKAFKKGTIHLEFKDEALWTKFNLTVNKGKNIIGDTEAA